ncbi:hypothetical protein CCACVL1_28372, partial [Corchorus capsularis]
MASSTARITFRIVILVFLLLALFYVGRPLYWKISATIHDIRHNKKTVQQGKYPSPSKNPLFKKLSFSCLSSIMHEAQKSVGWYHDESDSGIRDDRSKQASRRLLFK